MRSYATEIMRTAVFSGIIFLAIQRCIVAAFAPIQRPPVLLDRYSSRCVAMGALKDYRSSADEAYSLSTRTIISKHENDDDGDDNYNADEVTVTSAFSMDNFDSSSTAWFENFNESNNDDTVVVDAEPSQIGFVFPEAPQRLDPAVEAANAKALLNALPGSSSYYPFAAMMQGSAPYIAAHANKIVVFHVPGELLEDKKASDALLQDIALCWLLDMKIVIVASGRLSETDECALEKECSMEYSHEVSAESFVLYCCTSGTARRTS